MLDRYLKNVKASNHISLKENLKHLFVWLETEKDFLRDFTEKWLGLKAVVTGEACALKFQAMEIKIRPHPEKGGTYNAINKGHLLKYPLSV